MCVLGVDVGVGGEGGGGGSRESIDGKRRDGIGAGGHAHPGTIDVAPIAAQLAEVRGFAVVNCLPAGAGGVTAGRHVTSSRGHN